LFGEIRNAQIILNHYGIVAYNNLLNIPDHIKNVKLDVFCIMPNHIHLIIIIKNVELPFMAAKKKDIENLTHSSYKDTTQSKTISVLSKTIQQYKASVTREILESDIWQSKFYDHIIRNEQELKVIREYIVNNPAKWGLDKYYIIKP
jgi:putative transposase